MPRLPDPVGRYARRVVSGKEIAGELVQRACRRHLDDLRSAKRRGYRFDKRRALRAIAFFATLKHTKGKWARDFFHLSPAQEFIVGSIFGWVDRDGLRRFRTAYIEVARKFGKSELAGGLAILAAFYDEPREWGAEAFCAATKKDQAKIVFSVARHMLKRAPTYREQLNILTHRIVDPETGSYLTALGADADTLDGLSPHVVVIDELHAHPSSAVVDVMESATGARQQPLQIEITTAGRDTESICFEHHEYTERILDPNSDWEDDTWFGFIAAASPEDAIDDPAAWKKANPNLGVTVQPEWYETRARRAKASPTALAEFRRKNLDIWTADATRAIEAEVWDRGNRPLPEDLEGRPCFGGVDLATVNDLTAFVLAWPPLPGEREWYIRGRYYVPQERIEHRERTTKVPYSRWAREGVIVATPGPVTDHDFIEADIRKALELYDVREIAFDPARAGSVVQHLLAENAPLVEHRQGYISMAQPSADFERLLLSGDLVHGGDPCLRWQALNLVWAIDAAENKKPHKRKSKDKIDGIVALVMAIGRACAQPVETSSVYERRGVLTL